MKSFIKRKEKLIWIVYALERETKKVVSFTLGARNNKTLNVVLATLRLAKAKKIYSDGLKQYQFLIEKTVTFAQHSLQINSFMEHFAELGAGKSCIICKYFANNATFLYI